MTLMIAPVVGVPDGGVLPVSFQHVFQDGKLVFSAIIDAPHSAKAREELQLILEELRSLELFTIEEAVHKIRELCKKHSATLTSLAMGLFLEDQVIVLTSGGGTVYLSRNQKKGRLLHSFEPQVMGGTAQQGDQYIFLSEQLREKVGEEWKEYDGDPTKIADSISIEILQEQTSARYAGMIVQIGSASGEYLSAGVGSAGGRADTGGQRSAGKKIPANILKWMGTTGKTIGIKSIDLLKKGSISLFRGTKWLFQNLRELDKDELKEQSRSTLESLRQPKKFIPIVLLIAIIGIGVVWNTIYSVQSDSRVSAVMAPLEAELLRMQTSEIENLQERRDGAARLVQATQQQQAEHSPRSAERKALDEFYVRADQYSREISGQAELSTLDVYYNFRLLNGSFVATQVAKTETTVYFLDGENRLIVTLDLSSKQARMISVEGVPPILDLTVLGNQIFVLAEDGIYQVTSANGTTRRMIDREDSWQNPAFITSFGQNLYMFDLGSGALLRYAGSDGSFSAGSNWLRSTQGFQLNAVSSVTIDGRIWLGTQTGNVAAFSAGTRDSLQVTGLPSPLEGTVDIYTDAETDHLYVLSRNQQRVVKLSKQGEFIQEWTNPSLAAATHVLAVEPMNTLLIAAGSQVFSIPLE